MNFGSEYLETDKPAMRGGMGNGGVSGHWVYDDVDGCWYHIP